MYKEKISKQNVSRKLRIGVPDVSDSSKRRVRESKIISNTYS